MCECKKTHNIIPLVWFGLARWPAPSINQMSITIERCRHHFSIETHSDGHLCTKVKGVDSIEYSVHTRPFGTADSASVSQSVQSTFSDSLQWLNCWVNESNCLLCVCVQLRSCNCIISQNYVDDGNEQSPNYYYYCIEREIVGTAYGNCKIHVVTFADNVFGRARDWNAAARNNYRIIGSGSQCWSACE